MLFSKSYSQLKIHFMESKSLEPEVKNIVSANQKAKYNRFHQIPKA